MREIFYYKGAGSYFLFVILLFLISFLSIPIVDAATLIAAYDFNESSGTNVQDKSGNGNTGIISGATRTSSGKYGRALSFDGVNDWVTVNDSNSLDLTTGMTLEAWVYPLSNGNKGWRTIIAKEIVSEVSYSLYASSKPNNKPAQQININGEQTIYGTQQLPLSTWTFIAATYDGNTQKLYVNGNELASVNRSGSINISSYPLRFGGNNLFSEFFNGRIDEIRIYNSALTQLEIQQDMNTPIGSISADIIPPNVSIVNPANNTMVTGMVNVVANASDNVGVVGVQFLLNGVNFGTEDTSFPYSVVWNTSGYDNGFYNWTARARDARNNTKLSDIVVLQVSNSDSALPTVFVTHSPSNINNNTLVTISANASDNVGISGIDIYVDDSLVKSCASSSCSLTPGLYSVGTHNYYAVAFDTSNNSARDPVSGSKTFSVSEVLYLTRIVVSPASVSLNLSSTQQFTASGFDQYNNSFAITPVWSVNGGTINQNGFYTANAVGNYLINATQNGVVGNANVEVILNSSNVTNQAPSVNAGTDQAIQLPNNANLVGTASDDGLPSGTLTTTWSKVSGPGSVTFGDASALSTTASFSTSGNYVLRLTANDSVLSSSDDINITVSAAPALDRIVVSPVSASLNLSSTQQFTASGFDQYNNSFAITPVWSASGGTINQSGFYTANAVGNFTVMAAYSGINGTARVSVIAQSNSSNSSQANLSFQKSIIDNTFAGDVKAIGDIDGDGYNDVLIGGYQMNLYLYPSFTRTTIATPNIEFTTDMQLADIDNDGDLDIVVGDGDQGGNNVIWLENPRPSGSVSSTWTRHIIGNHGTNWVHDIEISDLDADGKLDAVVRKDGTSIFFQDSSDSWTKRDISSTIGSSGQGLGMGDIDGDGDSDIIAAGAWFETPAAPRSGTFTKHIVASAYSSGENTATMGDINGDTRQDILFAPQHIRGTIAWYEAPTDPKTGTWTAHTIDNNMGSHKLTLGDLNKDGKLDLVAGLELAELSYYLNDGLGTFTKTTLSTSGIHNQRLGDIDNDGDLDIFGANYLNNPPVELWRNQLNAGLALDKWTYKQISSNHEQTFGLTFGDVNKDGKKEIISGHYWYNNPGGDMSGSWTQNSLPTGMHAILVSDVDGDNLIDIIAQKTETNLALYWLEPTTSAATSWNSVRIGEVPVASHALGAQGYRAAQIELGGRNEILISSGGGIYYFKIPANPTAGNWPNVQVNANPSDEGFAVGDIDRDGDLDVAATTGDLKGVQWYRNPRTGAGNWQSFQIGTFNEALYPDRTELADVNKDGKLDIIVTEENTGTTNDAQTYYWIQPSNPTNTDWVKTLILNQWTTNNLDVADMDKDGDTDIILAEHRGSLTLSIMSNSGSGSFAQQIVDTGKESHLGAKTVDLDNDGDLDIVSIAYDAPQYLHMWRNNANIPGSGTTPPTNNAPSVNAGNDITITLPASANLVGTASDDGLPSGTLTTTWSKVSGPGSVTFGNVNSLSTNAAFSTSGNYVLRLTANDSVLSSSDDINITVNAAPLLNRIVVSPNNISLNLNALQQFTASGFDQYNNSFAITPVWSVNGGTINQNGFYTANVVGNYVINATQNGVVGNANVEVILNSSNVTNQAPSVNAGTDQAIQLPNNANLVGTASDDGLPSGTLTTTWSKVSGPGSVTFGNASALSTTASFSAAGNYVLRLSANDSVLSSSDDINITVNAAPLLNRIVVSPASVSLNLSSTQQFTASGFDQYNNSFAITPVWSASGGTINQNGFYTANTVGNYLINATQNGVVGSANVNVLNVSSTLTRGLVAYWKFDESSGSTTADSAGTRTATLVNGPTRVAGKVNNALNFDGINDYISMTDLALNNNAYSLSFWFNYQSTSGGWGVLFTDYDHSSGDNGLFIETTSNRFAFWNSREYYFGPTLVSNSWHHAVVVVNSGTATLYLDGISSGTTGNAPTITLSAIGSNRWPEPYKGILDEVRVYNRTLTASEASELYNL